MPCCAFAATIVAQLLFGARALKRLLFGRADGDLDAGNPVVAWRLGDAGEAASASPLGARWAFGRWSLAGLALAAVLEVSITAGAIYGLALHLGRHGGHAVAGHHGASAAAASQGHVHGPRTTPRGDP